MLSSLNRWLDDTNAAFDIVFSEYNRIFKWLLVLGMLQEVVLLYAKYGPFLT